MRAGAACFADVHRNKLRGSLSNECLFLPTATGQYRLLFTNCFVFELICEPQVQSSLLGIIPDIGIIPCMFPESAPTSRLSRR